MGNYDATASLDGTSTNPAGVWTAAAGPTIACSGLVYGGAMVDIPVTLATGRTDLALNPPTFTAMDFTLTIDADVAGVHDYGYYLWLVNLPTPPDFSTGATGNTSPTAYLIDGTILAMDNQVITGPLTAGQEITSGLDADLVYPLYRQSAWVGRFGFVWLFYRIGSVITTIDVRSSLHGTTPETLATTELPFIGGRSGNVEARSRVDRCPICGFYDVREKFIPDGYRAGLLVCEKCWDPEDPPSQPIPPDVPPIND